MTTLRTVVVPCFDEARRFDSAALCRLLDARTRLLLVDDGSSDGTRALLNACAAAHPRAVAVLPLDDNLGKAEAVRRGLARAIDESVDVVGYFDADLAAPPEEMRRVLDRLDDPRVAAALGSRVRLLGSAIDRRPLRHYLGRVFATAASLALQLPVYDTQCGAKAFRVAPPLRAALDTPFSSRWAFDVELLARLLDAGMAADAIVEVPLTSWRDVRGGHLDARALVGAAATLARVAGRGKKNARR
jgi:glycosyltransferase involved in cell wall biosynthesis